MPLQNKDRKEIWSSDQCRALKGILALAVLWCHVALASKLFYGTLLSPIFGSLGYLSVSVFFFISGYGIMAQLQRKGDIYLKSFLRNRVLSIWLINLSLIFIYSAYNLICGGEGDWTLLMQSLTIGNSIVSNGWYLQVVVLFYLLFYIAFLHYKDEKALVAISLGVIFYVIVASMCLSSTWYECSLSFLLGIFWSKYKKLFDKILTSPKWWLKLSVSILIFLSCYIISHVTLFPGNIGIIVRIIFKILSSPTFVVLVGVLISKINLQMKLLVWLGTYSLDIYVLQGIFLNLFRRDFLNIENGLIYCLAVFSCTIFATVLMHKPFSFVMNLPKRSKIRKN